MVPCPSCGGNAAGPPVPVCCGHYIDGVRCCDNPYWEPAGYCADCNGQGFIQAEANGIKPEDRKESTGG